MAKIDIPYLKDDGVSSKNVVHYSEVHTTKYVGQVIIKFGTKRIGQLLVHGPSTK
jgi:hypothetical protein